jgi:2-aminoadipate transaminase
MAKTPKSFIREILKVTANPEIISFAGGLPNPELIDVDGIRKAAAAVLEREGKIALQYSTTGGYPPLSASISRTGIKNGSDCLSLPMKSLLPMARCSVLI